MTGQDFDHVRAAFAVSLPGRCISGIETLFTSAWRTAFLGSAFRRVENEYHETPAPVIVRKVAVAIAIAAAMQPLVIRLMPLTVRPAMPVFVYVIVAALAIVTAWQAGAIVTGWPASRLARVVRRR